MQQIPFFYVTLCGKIQKFREITQIHKFVCFHGIFYTYIIFIGTTLLFYPCESKEGQSVEATPRHLIIVDGSIMQAIPEHPKRDFIFCLSTAFGDAYLFQVIVCTLKTRFSEPRFCEILNLMNKIQLPFSYFTLYPDSI